MVYRTIMFLARTYYLLAFNNIQKQRMEDNEYNYIYPFGYNTTTHLKETR